MYPMNQIEDEQERLDYAEWLRDREDMFLWLDKQEAELNKRRECTGEQQTV